MRRSLAAVAVLALAGAAARAGPDQALGLTTGFAVAVPDSNARQSGYGAGIMLMAEYVKWPGKWLSPRGYTGAVFTSPAPSCDEGVSPCDIRANLFFLGAKLRLLLPIPYVGPFLELGVGASAGHMAARIDQSLSFDTSGVFFDLPFAFGLALGAEHRFQLSFQFLFHPGESMGTGALSIGYDFSI
ncbi:MAG TPA: hypothetical protein VFE76_10875 [Myxococcales bacterium]|nr:hypothetical protein [Myxococcales bacterium]